MNPLVHVQNERLAPDAVSDARLLSREWNTYDLDGQQTGHVEGEGVIGLHPHVYPGVISLLSPFLLPSEHADAYAYRLP